MLDDTDILEQYIPLVDFLGGVLGKDFEIVLHNFSNPDASIIAICHGWLSGREQGGPMTNLVTKMLKHPPPDDRILNYVAMGANGKRFRSSTMLIRNRKGETIGALCINADIEKFHSVLNSLAFMCGTEQTQYKDAEEVLHKNTKDALNVLLEEALANAYLLPGGLSAEDKLNIVKKLYHSGAFMYKGSVPTVAKALCVSLPTLYRYLAKAKEQGEV